MSQQTHDFDLGRADAADAACCCAGAAAVARGAAGAGAAGAAVAGGASAIVSTPRREQANARAKTTEEKNDVEKIERKITHRPYLVFFLSSLSRARDASLVEVTLSLSATRRQQRAAVSKPLARAWGRQEQAKRRRRLRRPTAAAAATEPLPLPLASPRPPRPGQRQQLPPPTISSLLQGAQPRPRTEGEGL